MGRVGDRLNAHRLLGLDTSVFIYHLEAHPRYLPLTQELLAGIQAGRWQAVTSVVALMEITVRPWRLNRGTAARQYELLLTHFPNLAVLDITRTVARRAAQLRARYNVGPPDPLQAAAALVHGATAFVTNDRGLSRLAPLLEVIVLDDLLAS